MTVIEMRSTLHGLGLNPARRRFWICYGLGLLDCALLVAFVTWVL